MRISKIAIFLRDPNTWVSIFIYIILPAIGYYFAIEKRMSIVEASQPAIIKRLDTVEQDHKTYIKETHDALMTIKEDLGAVKGEIKRIK